VLEAEVVRTPELNLALCRDCQPNHPDLGEYDSMASLVGQGYELSQRDKRLASFARVWLALESEACGVTGMGFDEHVEFDWFKMETNQHANGNYLPSDKVLLDMIKAQGQVEGHVFPDQIRDTLRVMLHG
tara:strand:+ start:872 stop:1261 length:390 start_codon:yes stop_codon:yes gene_type:complete